MTPQEAARILGGRAYGNRVQCPGPGHGADDMSLTILFSQTGFAVHSFSSSDDWKECKDYVRTRLGLADDWKPDPTKIAAVKQSDDHFGFAMHIWRQCQPIAGTIVQRYLESRSIILPDCTSIGYHPSLKYNDTTHAAMVCLYRDIHTNEPRGIHRTFLSDQAVKIDRKMLGSAYGAAIKLDDNETVTTGLCVGEGVETCLSARQMGYAPTWALMSSRGVSDFPVLSGIDAITFLGERDKNRANEIACKAAAKRWIAEKVDAYIYFPVAGKDMNDAIRGDHG